MGQALQFVLFLAVAKAQKQTSAAFIIM